VASAIFSPVIVPSKIPNTGPKWNKLGVYLLVGFLRSPVAMLGV
jgi:hypothetical protein